MAVFSTSLLLRSAMVMGITGCLGFASIQHSVAQGSLSGANASKAKNLLTKDSTEKYLQSDYYKELINNTDLYGLLPDDMRRIFARIRFIALSINDTEASDQVLNALSRAYLIFGMEAAAVNEGIKIIQPSWKARTLIDISDYYNIVDDISRRDALLDQALNILNGTSDTNSSIRQYYFDIATRYAIAGSNQKSLKVINRTFGDPIFRIMGFMQIAERIQLGRTGNSLISTDQTSLLNNITRCKPNDIFIIPQVKKQSIFSLNKNLQTKNIKEESRFYISEAFSAFKELAANTQSGQGLDVSNLDILLALNKRLFNYSMKNEAQEVLDIIVKQFLHNDNLQTAADGSGQSSIKSSVESPTKTRLRNELIKAYIRNNKIRSGMDLTTEIYDNTILSMAYVNVGIAHNENKNEDAATALFNYAQDIALLITDLNVRDKVLIEVINGLSQARLYGSAFQNASEIHSLESRAEAFANMSRQMIYNNDLASAVQASKYIQPHDLRIQVLANLAYVRSLNPDSYYVGSKRMPETQEFFEEIYTLMETRLVGGVETSANNDADSVLMALCADAKRGDLVNRNHRGSPIDTIKQAEYSTLILSAATTYTTAIKDIVVRAKSFSNIAQIMIETERIDESQLFLDTAWNLAWSVRGKLQKETDKIFLHIVHGKIISNHITDAYNIATGMGAGTKPEDELYRNETTGEITYSDRIQALMDFSRAAMSTGEYSIALRAIEDIQVGLAKSVAMTDAIRDLITTESQFDIDRTLNSSS